MIKAALLALLLASSVTLGLESLSGWDSAAYAGWPGVGLAVLLFLGAGESGRWPMFAAQTLALGVVLGLVHDGSPWLGAVSSLAVTVPAMVTARWVRPGTPAFRRFNEDEVDAYHGVTAISGVVCGVLTLVPALVDGRGDLSDALLTGLIAFLAATTSQLVLLPFWLRRAGGWRTLGSSVELWGQRTMFVVFLALVFVPDSNPPVTFILFPILGWTAMRAAAPETHLQVLITSVAAVAATMSGRGPLGIGSPDDPDPVSALLVYLFIASLCYLLIPLALTVERLTSVTGQATRAAKTVRRMLDSATGTVFIATDPDGVITHYGPGAQQALGFPEEQVVGRHASRLHTTAEIARQAGALGLGDEGAGSVPEHRGSTDGIELYRRIVAAQISAEARLDWEFLHRDGVPRVLSLSISPMTERGELLGFIATGEDSTDRVNTQRALEQALRHEQSSVEALRAADDVKQELVSTVSHELRTPLTSIAGYVELLRDGELGELEPPQAEALDRIGRNTVRLERLVSDLLTLSRTQSEASLTTIVDLNDVVAAVREQLADEHAVRDVAVEVAPSVEPVLVLGDHDLLERAVANLWGNAVKFTPDGGRVVISVRTGASGDGGRTGVVAVRDTGIGIASVDHDAVFHRFYRTASAGERAIQGTGLGLSIVKTIVEQHHGDIELDSEPDVGTEITVSLPRA